MSEVSFTTDDFELDGKSTEDLNLLLEKFISHKESTGQRNTLHERMIAKLQQALEVV